MIDLPPLFGCCEPRKDVREGRLVDADLAADLAAVLRGQAPPDYQVPSQFFANTHPTRGLRQLLREVFLRLADRPEQQAAIFRLDTSFGGGKTHGLIALAHAAAGMRGVAEATEFLDRELVPSSPIRVAAFDGEIADPLNGRDLGEGRLAHTPWGELAFRLAGGPGYERVRNSDQARIAPGAETLAELLKGAPALILLDELGVYLRKAGSRDLDAAAGQLTAFLTALFKAVEATPRTALVFTLALGKLGQGSGDAYREENQRIAKAMDEAASVAARKATLLEPTGEDEAALILRRRLFASIDGEYAARVASAYRELWTRHAAVLPGQAAGESREDQLRACYPFHPELIDLLKEKTSTLADFQRIRGMLRLLSRAVAQLWAERPAAHAIHIHHLDPGNEIIRREITTRLQLSAFLPAILADVASVGGDQPALSTELDRDHYSGMPTYGTYVARTILWHSFAFNDPLKGVTPDRLRAAVLAPGMDPSFIDDATRRFQAASAYLDDRPTAPLCFRTEPNLTQLIRKQERIVDRDEARVQLDDRIRRIFEGKSLGTICFPHGPGEVPDDDGDGKPYLVVMGYEAVTWSGAETTVPDLVRRVYERAGSQSQSFRLRRNHVAFLVADKARVASMRDAQIRRLALADLLRQDVMQQLAPHQQQKLQEEHKRSEQELGTSIQNAYRHLFYPSRAGLEEGLTLAHAAIEIPSTSAEPGQGQKAVVRTLQEANQLLVPGDHPPQPSFVQGRTPLRKGQITTAALIEQFRSDTSLPMLGGNDLFVRLVRDAVEGGAWVYQRGELIGARGTPTFQVTIDEQSLILTADYARDASIWPRPPSVRPPDTPTGRRPVAPGR